MNNHEAELEAGLGVYLSATQITRAFGICRSGIFALMKKGLFPVGVKIGRCRRWSLSEVQEWLKHQKEGEQLCGQ